MYPNPAQDAVNALFYSDTAGTGTLQISDIAGRVVAQQLVEVEAGDNPVTLQVNTLSPGFYVVSCVFNQQFYTVKLSIY